MGAPRSTQPLDALREALESLRLRYSQPAAVAMDPLAVVLDYVDSWDQEVAAWVAAHLAYGRVPPMLRAIRRALAPLGDRPAAWLRGRTRGDAEKQLVKALQGWCWRFHTSNDLVQWLLAWQRLDEASGRLGLESHLVPTPDASADLRLSTLVHRLRKELPTSQGLRFSLPDPLAGSACKRWRMFMRWMVRREWPDLGLWRQYPQACLVIPLDTHVIRVATLVGLTERKSPDGRMAQEITEALARVCPEDPLRYDFALAHLGILGDCVGLRDHIHCPTCPLRDICHSR